MTFLLRFKNKCWLYFLLLGVTYAVGAVFVLLIPPVYINWDVPKLAGFAAVAAVAFGMQGFLLADVWHRKLCGRILLPTVGCIVGGGVYFLCQAVLSLLLKVGLAAAITVGEVVLMILLSASSLYLFLRAADAFGWKKSALHLTTPLLAAVMMVVLVLPFGAAFARRYLRPYSFLTLPSVFLSAQGYSVVFATSAVGTGGVCVTQDGVSTTYYEANSGVRVYNSQLHRVDLPREALHNATYHLISQQTLNCEDHHLRRGVEICSQEFTFHEYSGDGDVSFLVVSDNQGTPAPTAKAVSRAAATKDYDFVMMLGDHAETYNSVEDDIVGGYLRISGLASRGELPVLATLGNHEYRGMLAPDLWRLLPTLSPNGEFYYTFRMGDAFFTVMCFGSDHNDDYWDMYGGLVDFNHYKDDEYLWLQSVLDAAPYQDATYNVMLSHIPLIFANDVPAYQHWCGECQRLHDYKFQEFCSAAQQMGVQYVVSGHTHVAPNEFTAQGYDFPNLQTGSYYAGRKHFRNCIVHLQDGTISYEIYSSEE